MMNKQLLLTMSLLFVGGSMMAQSVAVEQMDERFNDGTKLPYGWFTEGWTVKDGAIQTEASSGFSFDLESLFGTGQTEENQPSEGDPSGGNETKDGEEEGSPSTGLGEFDISSLLSSLMGGSKPNYLLTPPLVVKAGEKLVFSARKDKGGDSSGLGMGTGSGGGTSFSFGASDSTFVVERTVYSQEKWVRVADLTLELDTIFKTFTIADTPEGEYRFRFKAGGTVLIDSVAGFHFDSEAPDIYVIENDARAKDIDFSLCTEDSTRTLTVINTATGTLKLAITSDDEDIFSLSQTQMEVAAADSVDVSVTFNVVAGQPGKNEAQISFRPDDERVYGTTIYTTAVVTQSGVWAEDFNTNTQPKGIFTEGWEFHDNVATTSSGGGMAAMFGGGGSTSFLMTPPLTVYSVNEVLLFSVKGGGGDSMAGLGSLFGGGGSSIVVEKSAYGSNKWEKVREFTEPLDSVYRTLWVSYIEPGEYRFRIVASDSIVVDSIAGFHIDNDAPDIYVLHNNTAVTAVNYGMPQANATETFAIVNTGTGTLRVGATSTDDSVFALSGNSFAIEANDTATVDVTYLFDEQSMGIHQGAVTFKPYLQALTPITAPLTAYSTYADAWFEDFEPEYLVEDESLPRELPVGWETTGWEVKLPSSGGGLMDMLGGVMGGAGDAAPKTWMATTANESYELITPRLQAVKGDVLRFQVELGGGGGLMDLLGMFMGGSMASGQLYIWYSRDNEDGWTYYDTVFQNGFVYFVAPYTGVYRLRFTSPGASVDNFYGLRAPIPEVGLYDGKDDINAVVLDTFDGQTVNVSYDRVLSAGIYGDGTFTPCAYTICLPYDIDFSQYADPGKVRLYKLSFIDNYYDQFVFTSVADKAEAGRAYLAVVERGDVRMDAVAVKLTKQIADDESASVSDYEGWYFDESLTRVGQWTGTFSGITAAEADAVNMYCLLEDGSWARFTSEDNADARLSAFRAYYLADQAAGEGAGGARAKARANQGGKVFQTLFTNAGVTSVTDVNVPDALNMLFNPDIPSPSTVPTGIAPTIRTIEADGTSRYFDLQGRMLNGKPAKGLYIENGHKMTR